MTDNKANIYDIQEISIKPRDKSKDDKQAKVKAVHNLFNEMPGDQKKQLVVSVQKELTDEQIRHIRRREYYNRRVK